MNFFANIFDIIIGLHFSKTIENVLKTRISKLVLSIIGLCTSISRVILVKEKNAIRMELNLDDDSSDSFDDFELSDDD